MALKMNRILTYFQLEYQDGKIEILPKIKEMLPVDDIMFQRDLLPQHSSKLEELPIRNRQKADPGNW
jgi:hypothetical protein